MTFREQGIRQLHAVALASFRQEAGRYSIHIDPWFDDLDIINEVLGLPEDVIASWKSQTGECRVHIQELEPTTDNGVQIVDIKEESVLDPLVVNCRDSHEPIATLKHDLLNPVLKENPFRQKFSRRAGDSTDTRACPPSNHRGTRHTRHTPTRETPTLKEIPRYVNHYHDTSSHTHQTARAHRQSPSDLWPSVTPRVTHIGLDGVTVYDSAT